MITPEIDFTIGCIPCCRVIDNYDAWRVLGEVFSHYPLGRLKTGFWDMFKAALLDRDTFSSTNEINTLTFLYEHLHDLTISVYLIAKDKGLSIPHDQASLTFNEGFNPWDSVTGICSAYKLSEIKEELWRMFQSAISEKGPNLTKDDRRNMISVFESLTDIAMAAYVIVSKLNQENEK